MDPEALTALASAYLGRHDRWEWEVDYDSLEIVETERRGTTWQRCIPTTRGTGVCANMTEMTCSRTAGAGGRKPSLSAGKLGSWNFGTGETRSSFSAAGDLPEEAASYTFQNSGITYICPIEDGQVLDVFLLPDTADIGDHHLELLGENGAPLDWPVEGTIGTGPVNGSR